MAAPSSVYINGDNGLQLHATTWPQSGKPVCVLLHGFGHDSRVWDPLARALQQQFEIVALDFRGHGKSDWDAQKRYCHNALLEDLHTLVEHLELQQFHLLGHSLGARVAMLYAADQPQHVTSLGILDTGPVVGLRGANRIRQDATTLPRSFDSREDYFQYLCQSHPLAKTECLQAMAEHGLRELGGQWQPRTDPEFARELWQQDAEKCGNHELRYPLTEELWQCLEVIRCETLVLRGQISSILKPDIAQAMVQDKLALGKLESIPMAGHALMLDNPEHCVETISAFLKRVQARQTHIA